ncbi:PKD domain-containing protein [Spirosoma utsteinense]|uniref:PKD domain-containing protein n=1 Tax=Spirosoma utsteinense TaxID=2585773 RepID=UPI001648C943|nr:choice-of-anchor Q domain-containing protein [Spirosoma utsteinense]MBC3787793.1 hypothetical protein [Spirosoma utsteinense]
MLLFTCKFSLRATSRLGGHIVCLLSSARWPGPLWAWLLVTVVWTGLVRPSAQAQSSTIRYVSPQGAGSQSGTSWANALPGTTLQAAINASSAGNQVWVARGVYKPTAGSDSTKSFTMQPGVAIYGGFVGTETSLSDRPTIAPVADTPSSSTLSGDIGRVGDKTDNSFHVIYNPASLSLTSTAILDGFVITGGNARRSSSSDDSGGGIYNNGSGSVCSPQIRYCTFVANSAAGIGGAMVNDGKDKGTSSPSLTNCAFVANTSAYNGGAIYNTGQNGTSSPTLINCAFMANTASNYGGAMVNEGTQGVSSPNLINCTFLANSGGAMYNPGFEGNSSPHLTNCVLFGNDGTNTLYNSNGGSVTASYSLFDDTVTGYTEGGTNQKTTTSPFASLTSVALADDSPAIDAGSNQAYSDAGGPQTDLAGNPRVYPTGRTIDMGAVEFQRSAISNLSASPNPVVAGQPITFTATVGNITGIYNFTLGNGIDTPLSGTASGATFSQTLTALGLGAQTYTLTVAANDNRNRTTATVPVTVLPRTITLTGLSASPNPVVAGQFINFYATVDNLIGPYSYTLANGLGSTVTGRASSAAFSQTLRARGSGPQTYTLTVANEDGRGSTTVDLTVTPGPAVANGPACTDFTNRTTDNAGFGSNSVRGVYAQGERVYVATLNGLSISYDRGRSFNINQTTDQGLGSNFVRRVYAQGDTVYAATDEGLSISTNGGGTFANKTTNQGLGDNRVYGVYAQGNTIYAATQNGLSISQDGGSSFINHTQGLGFALLQGVYAVDKTVYAATGDGLSISTDGGQSFTMQDRDFLYGVYVAGNTVYTATIHGMGISRDGGNTFVFRSLTENSDDKSVSDVYAQGNTVYAATSNGLSISTDGGQSFTNYTPSNTNQSLGNSIVTGVYALGDRLYAATEGGLSYCSLNPTLMNLSASPNPVTAGQPTAFTATVGGVKGAYSYTLTNGADTPLSGTASSPTFSQALTATGSGPQTYTLTVTSPEGKATGTTSLTVLTRPVTITDLSASPNPVQAGQPITFTARVANLKGGYAYSLVNGLGSTLTGTADTNPFSQTLTARGSGPQTYTLTVSPFDAPTSVSATVDITISPGPAVADGPACSNFITRYLFNPTRVPGVYALGSTVYAATNQGLFITINADGGNSFTSKRTTENGLGSDNVNAVYAVGSTVYAATDGGLSIATDGGQRFTNHTTGLGSNQVRAVYVVDNTIYVATPGGLAVSTDGGQSFANRTSTNGLGDNLVNGVFVVDNTVYAATNNGLGISTNGGSSFAVNRTTASPTGIASNVVLGVYAVGLTVYVATNNGLSISTDGGQTFANRTTTNGLGSNTVNAVYAVGNTVYAATQGGLGISTDGGQRFTNYTTANTQNGLGSDIVEGVSVAGDRIYAATRGGVSFCPGPAVLLTLTNLSASPNPVPAGQSVTFTAAVGGVTGTYNYTLSNGVDTPLSGTANGSAFRQALTASGAGAQTYSLTVTAENGVATASTALTVLVPSSAFTITGLSANRYLVPVGQSVEFTATLTGLVDADIYSYTLTNGLEDKPLTGDFHGPDFRESVTAQGSGPQTYTLTVVAQKGTATATVAILVTRENVGLERFAILGVSPVSCETLSEGQRRLTFTPQYVGANGEPISFSVVNELAPTTSPGPYSLPLYTDNPTITLSAQQGGRGEVRYIFNWLAACPLGATQPQSPTTSGIPSQTLLQGQPYRLDLAGYVTDPDGQTPLFTVQGLPTGLSTSDGVLSGTPSATGTYPVSLTATDPGGLAITLSFQLTIIPAPDSSVGFSIGGVTPVSCSLVDSVKQGYQVRFTPQYGGLTGQPIRFEVVNELAPTTQPGPYALTLYADNPVISLKATQQGSQGEARFSYNWLAACSLQLPATPPSFALVNVTTVRCEVGSGEQRRLTFSPQYAGVTGSPISFSVVNELAVTTAPGPYNLNLYTDNPTITLSAQQGESVSTYRYHWLGACTAPARVGAGEARPGLQVRVLGNPVTGQEIRVEVRGAEGQALRLFLSDWQGRSLYEQQVEQASEMEPLTLPLSASPPGVLLLRVSIPGQAQTVKLLRK